MEAGPGRRPGGGERRRAGPAADPLDPPGALGTRACARVAAAVRPAGRLRVRPAALRIQRQTLRALLCHRAHAGAVDVAGGRRTASTLVAAGAARPGHWRVAVHDAGDHAADQRRRVRARSSRGQAIDDSRLSRRRPVVLVGSVHCARADRQAPRRPAGGESRRGWHDAAPLRPGPDGRHRRRLRHHLPVRSAVAESHGAADDRGGRSAGTRAVRRARAHDRASQRRRNASGGGAADRRAVERRGADGSGEPNRAANLHAAAASRGAFAES